MADIEKATKVSASLFVALERNDLSRWPAGIYRRAFIRGYAAAAGLSVEATVNEFLTLFPDPEQATVAVKSSAAPLAESPLRLTLAVADPRGALRATAQLRQAMPEVLALLLLALLVTWWTGEGVSMMAGIMALCYVRPAVGVVRRRALTWRKRSTTKATKSTKNTEGELME